MGPIPISGNQCNLYGTGLQIALVAFTISFKADNPIKKGHDNLDIIYKPHMAESCRWNGPGWDDLDSYKTSCFERPQPSRHAGQCKVQVENGRSRLRNNVGSCKRY